MTNYKQEFMRHLNIKGVKFCDEGESRLRIIYSGENLQTIPLVVAFDDDGDGEVEFFCYQIANIKTEKIPAILFVCNELNCTYRWVKFFVDKDRDVICRADAIIDFDTVGEECLKIVLLAIRIVDEAYPKIMKAMWD